MSHNVSIRKKKEFYVGYVLQCPHRHIHKYHNRNADSRRHGCHWSSLHVSAQTYAEILTVNSVCVFMWDVFVRVFICVCMHVCVCLFACVFGCELCFVSGLYPVLIVVVLPYVQNPIINLCICFI